MGTAVFHLCVWCELALTGPPDSYLCKKQSKYTSEAPCVLIWDVSWPAAPHRRGLGGQTYLPGRLLGAVATTPGKFLLCPRQPWLDDPRAKARHPPGSRDGGCCSLIANVCSNKHLPTHIHLFNVRTILPVHFCIFFYSLFFGFLYLFLPDSSVLVFLLYSFSSFFRESYFDVADPSLCIITLFYSLPSSFHHFLPPSLPPSTAHKNAS